MTDERAKNIIKAYQLGETGLSEYVEAIEHLAEYHPDMDMVTLINWVDSEENNIC